MVSQGGYSIYGGSKKKGAPKRSLDLFYSTIYLCNPKRQDN